MPDSLEDLRQRLGQFAQVREWDQFHSPKNLAMALIAETAELVEHFQWLSEEDSRSLSSKKRQAVGEELADILIYIVLRPDDIDGFSGARKKINMGDQPVGARAQDWSFQFKLAQHRGWLPNVYLFWAPPFGSPANTPLRRCSPWKGNDHSLRTAPCIDVFAGL